MNSNLDDFDDDDFGLLSEDEATPVDYLQLQLDSSPYLQGDATQDDYDNIFSFTNRWKGWALLASPPRVGSSSRSKFSLQSLRQEWIDVEAKRQEENAKTSEFASQWKSVLLKYNQKLSKAEEEKSASQAVSDVTPFNPLLVDLRGLHAEEQILVGIWRQLGLPNAQNLAQLQQVVVGFLVQQSKATLVVFDHVSKRAATHVAQLFSTLSDLMGLLVIADITIDAHALLVDYPEKDQHLAEHFTNEVAEFCGILKLPWDIATEKENERVLISSTTLTNRAAKSLAANLLGYAPDSLFASSHAAKHHLKSPSGFFDAQLGMTGKTDFDGMPLEQKAAIIESIEIVAELSDGIPGLLASLIHVELPVLRLLQQRRLDSKPIRTRLLSTSRYVNAGRVFVAVARVVAALADVCLAVDKDRRDFLSVLQLQSYHLDGHPSGDNHHPTAVESYPSLLCAHDLAAQGISDAFLASLVSKGFLLHHPPAQTYVVPSTVALVIAQLYPTATTSHEDERARTKAFLFRQQCANLAHDFRQHVAQRWILANGDLRLVPISVVQQHIVLRKLETLLPQLQTVIHAVVTNEHRQTAPLAHEDIVQGLFLLVTGGASVVSAWCSLDTRLTLLQSLASLVRSWTADDLKRCLTSTLQVLESSRHPALTVHSLLLDAVTLLQETALEWWWLAGADIFTPKQLSSRLRHVHARGQRSQAADVVALIGRWLAVSGHWISEATTTSSLTTSSRTTAAVFLQREHLLRTFKHRVFEAFLLSDEPLDRFELPAWQATVDEFAVQLQALSAQTRAALDSLDVSQIDLDDELSPPLSQSAATAETTTTTAPRPTSTRHLIDRLPATQRLLLSLKNFLKHRYDAVLASSTLQNASSTSLTSLSSPLSSAASSPEKAASPSARSPRRQPSMETTNRLKAEEALKATKRMDLFELSIEHVERAMLLRIASGAAELLEAASGSLLQLILRRYPSGVLKAAAVANSTLEGFSAPSAASPLALRGRLLFSASLIRSFSASVGLPTVLPAATAAAVDTAAAASPMTLVGDTEEDQLLWTAYLQRLADEQEGLSPAPWQAVTTAMYSHPIVREAEDRAMAQIHRLLAVAARCMRQAHQEHEKLYQVVDLAFLDEAADETDEGAATAAASSSTWRDTMALANISSVAIANAGIVYADLVASLTLMGGAYALGDGNGDGNGDGDVEDEEERHEAALGHVTDARDICDDAVQIWSRAYSQYALQDALPRLVIGYAYYLLYELTMCPLQQAYAPAERYLGLVYHQSLETLTPAEAAQRLERHRHESQVWQLAFHYQAMAFRILRLLAWPRLHRACLQQTTIRGLNDYQRVAQYQATLQRVLEPSRSGSGQSSTSLPAPIPLPEDVLDTMHAMIKALQHATQYEYHRLRRSLDEELLSYYALATTTAAAAADGAADGAAAATTRILDLRSVDGGSGGGGGGESSTTPLTAEDLQQQHSVFALQLRLQQVAAQPLLLVYVARCYDSLVGAQSVAVPPLIATNVALPFVHPQQTTTTAASASSAGSSGGSGGGSGSGSEVTSSGYGRAMDLYRYLLQQYRELSNLCYAKELWDDAPPPPPPNGRHRHGGGGQRHRGASSRGAQPPTLTLWGHIVESVFPHPYDSFFHQPAASAAAAAATSRGTAAATAAGAARSQRRRKVVGGNGDEAAGDVPAGAHDDDERRSDADADAVGSDGGDGSGDDDDEAVRLVEGDEPSLLPSARRVLRLRESFPSLALRFADVLYLLAHAIYRDGLTRYKLAPQLHDEIAAPVFAQHVAAVTAARQIYEQELTPRQYCPISLIVVRQLAQLQQLQRDLDGALRSYEELLRLFLETKFTSLLVLAEIYTEYGDALLAKKEFFHASLMFQMAIDHYRDYDSERPAAAAVGDNDDDNDDDGGAPQTTTATGAAAAATEATAATQQQRRQRQLRGIAPAASSSSVALDGGVGFASSSSSSLDPATRSQRAALALDYAWALFVPEHLHEARVTEELLQARVAWNLAAKAKALFASEDVEQAQELAEQAQHLLALVMASTVKVPDADVVKKEQHAAQRQRQRRAVVAGDGAGAGSGNGDDEAATASHDAETDGASTTATTMTTTVATAATATTSATVSAATAAQRRRAQEERDDAALDAQLRRVVVVSPVAVDVYLLLALAHYQFDEFDDAERYFHKAETAVHALGDAESLAMVKIYHNRGVLQQARGDAAEAKLFFEQALWLLRRRHANAFFQWQSTLEALGDVYETLQAAEDVEAVAQQRDELDLRLGTLELRQRERTRDLERLLQGLFAWEQEQQWRLKQWSEEEAAYQGYDDDGHVDGHDDDFDASSSSSEDDAAADGHGSDGDEDGGHDEDGGGGLGARRGQRRRLRIQATLAASSSSDGDPSSSEDDDASSHGGGAGDVGHGGDEDDAAAARRRRRERRRLRRAKEARRHARRARRQAKAAALLRHRQRASQQQLSTPTQTSSASGKRGWSGANSPVVGPSSTSLTTAAAAAGASAASAAAAASPSPSSWQEYLSAKRLHPVASVGVDRMTVGMLRRAFHVLRERAAATDRATALALLPTTLPSTLPTSPSSSAAAALLPPKAAWPSVVVEPDDGDHRRGASLPPQSPAPSSSRVARPPPWQQLIRRQQHALFLGTQQLYSYDPDDDGDASPYVKTAAASAASAATVPPATSATAPATAAAAAAASTAKKPATGGKRSTSTMATTASDTATNSDAADDEDDLPELPSGNCVVC